MLGYGSRTPDLYRVNPQFIDLSTTYRCSRGLLTPLSACNFVQHRVGDVAVSKGTLNSFKLAQSTNRHEFHLPFRACHPSLAREGDFTIRAEPVTYRQLAEAAQLEGEAVSADIGD